MKHDIEIIDLDKEFSIQKGDMELSYEKEQDLRRIRHTIENDVRLSRKVLNSGIYGMTINIFANRKNNSIRRIQIFILVLSLVIIPISVYNKFSTYEIPSTLNIESEHTGTVINITTDDANNTLYSIDNLSIVAGDGYINTSLNNWISDNIDTNTYEYSIDNQLFNISKETELGTFLINSEYAYVKYINTEGTASKEIILSSNKPSNIDIKSLKRNGTRFFEKSGILQTKAYTNSYDNTFLMLVETLAGGELNIDTLQDTILNIEGSMYKSYSTSDINSISLDIDSLGIINVCKIPGLENNAQLIYDNITNVLRVVNKENNAEHIYIFNINNENMGCYFEDLLSTNIENIFIHKDFEDTNSIGYNTMAFKAGNNIYCMKFNTINSLEVQKNIFNQLGIEDKQIKVKRIQTVVPYSTERNR